MSVNQPKVNLERQYREGVWLQEIDSSDLEKSVDDLAEYFLDFKQKFPEHKNIRVLISHYYEGMDITLVGDRLETNQEMQDRIKNEKHYISIWKNQEKKKAEAKLKREKEAKKIATSRKADRKKLFEELKKEFGS